MECRPSWIDYFFSIAELASTRSTCIRRQVGAVIVKNKHILATGYNGAPSGVKHCSETGCLRKELNVPSGERHEICRGIHAEQNAIIQSAKHGVNINGSCLFIPVTPCSICMRMIMNSGIDVVLALEKYNDELTFRLIDDGDWYYDYREGFAHVIVSKRLKDKLTRTELLNFPDSYF